MEILIFENEYVYVEGAFNYVNSVYFDEKIKYTVYQKSQDLLDINDLKKYDFIFIDISLSVKSKLDGFGIIKKIEDSEIQIAKKRIVILTGNHKIKEILKEKELKNNYIILTKPIDFNDLLVILNNK